MLDLDPIKKRLAGATPGPWCHENIGEQENYVAVGIAWRFDDKAMIAVSGELHHSHDTHYVEGVAFCEEGTLSLGGSVHTNGKFIAHAPVDVAALMSEINRLRFCLNEIANAPGPPASPEPDDHDWRVVALELQRLAKLNLT